MLISNIVDNWQVIHSLIMIPKYVMTKSETKQGSIKENDGGKGKTIQLHLVTLILFKVAMDILNIVESFSACLQDAAC